MSVAETVARIKEWFEKGDESSKDLVEAPWEVEVRRDPNGKIISLMAVNPRFPLPFLVYPLERSVRISVPLKYETAYLDTKDRLKAYRSALMLSSKVELIKVHIMGDDEELTLSVDLSYHTLGEEEFDDALRMLYTAVVSLARALDIEKQLGMESMMLLSYILKKKIDEGASKDEIYAFLVKRAGIKEEDAGKIVDKLFGSKDTGLLYG